MHRYPTIAETMVPEKIAVQLYCANSDISILIKGYNNEAPKIIGILNKNEYLAAVTRCLLLKRPAAMVNPERENPGRAAMP